ncbi:MAG: PspC domain-containing protein [Proteobacteria bacterium]|uniref:PspC domain-containing protein n=1 Tax=Aquabacterium sp. TaxID=1872578 RepID=UPI0035C77A90|nr:PspC domain-containing protein [Pseudomonadota bacterium]
MSIADELDKLSALQERGVITAEEFARLKARLLDGELPPSLTPQPLFSPDRPLRRVQDDRWLGGVCGGLARLLGVESWLVRLAFTLLFLFWGAGLIVYILLWVFVPSE